MPARVNKSGERVSKYAHTLRAQRVVLILTAKRAAAYSDCTHVEESSVSSAPLESLGVQRERNLLFNRDISVGQTKISLSFRS